MPVAATSRSTPTSASAAPARDHGLDRLRVAVILLVVLLHAALSYMVAPPKWWYVLDPHQSLFFTGLVLVVDVPIMLIMFFLAGYFAFPSLLRRGPGGFLRDKAMRIGIPWVFGTLVLAPPTAYLIYYSRHFPVTLGAFWRTDFWGKAYQQSVYWYLGVLFLCFAATAALFAASPRFAAWRARTVPPKPWRLTAFVLALTAASLLITGHCSFDTWTHNYVLVYQPARMPLYFGYFGLGLCASQQRWFAPGGYRPRPGLWLSLGALSGLAYLIWRLAVPAAVTTLGVRTVTALLFNGFAFAALLAGVALCQAGSGRERPLWRSQARNAYGIYYLHPLLLYPLALLLVPYPAGIFLKAAAITLATYLACWGLSAAVLVRAPGLRRMF